MMITDNPKIKRLLQNIADSADLEETKTLTKDVVEMLGTIIINLEADIFLAQINQRTISQTFPTLIYARKS